MAVVFKIGGGEGHWRLDMAIAVGDKLSSSNLALNALLLTSSMGNQELNERGGRGKKKEGRLVVWRSPIKLDCGCGLFV